MTRSQRVWAYSSAKAAASSGVVCRQGSGGETSASSPASGSPSASESLMVSPSPASGSPPASFLLFLLLLGVLLLFWSLTSLELSPQAASAVATTNISVSNKRVRRQYWGVFIIRSFRKMVPVDRYWDRICTKYLELNRVRAQHLTAAPVLVA